MEGPSGWYSFFKLFREKFWVLLMCVLGALLQSAALVAITLVVKRIFDQAIPEKNSGQLLTLSLVIIILYLFNGLMVLSIRYQVLSITQKIITKIRYKFSEAVYKYPDNPDDEVLHDLSMHEVERIGIMSNALFSQLIPSVLVSLAICMTLFYINTHFFLYTCLLIPFIVIISKWTGHLVRKSAGAYHQHFRNLNKNILSLLHRRLLTIMYNFVKQELVLQKERIQAVSESDKKKTWMQTAYTIIQDNLLAIGGSIIIMIGGYYVIQNKMTWGELFAFYVALALLKTYVYRVFTNTPQILEGKLSWNKVFTYLSQIPDTAPSAGKSIDFELFSVEFKNVSFSYPNQQKLLKQLDFMIAPHKITLIAGENGTGKSTLAKLIMGFYPPDEGEILVCGKVLDTLDLDHYRKQIGIVFQRPFVFEGSIRDNITYGNPYISDEELQHFSRCTALHEYVASLPDKYHTYIDHPSSLSGGQIQKIALTRALLKKPKLLILDEPTNHLDDGSISCLCESLKLMSSETSILIISHHSSLKNLANFIFKL